MKGQLANWQKIFASHMTNKGLISKIHEQLIKVSIKLKQPNQKWTEYLNRHFSKQEIHMVNKQMKRCLTLLIIEKLFFLLSNMASVQFSSVAQLCPILCDPIDRSTPGLPVHHQLPEFTETHIHQVSDAIQPSHPQLSPSPPAPNPSQHQGLFQ